MSETGPAVPTFDDPRPAAAGQACGQCGSPLDEHDRFCPACGGVQPEAASAAAEVTAAKSPQATHIRCENCGAEIASEPGRRSYVCPFCDSTYVVEFDRDAAEREQPEFVIGFAISNEQAHEAYRRWLAEGGLFRPGDLKSSRVDDKLTGVYLPFWSFSMLARSGWSASIGEYWYRTETYTTIVNGKTVTKTRRVRETEWWPLSGRHHQYHSGFLVSGSKGLPQSEAERIKPFQLPALKRYRPLFLAGWLSEEYSVERAAAEAVCKQEFSRRERDQIAAFLPGDTHSQLEARTEFSDINSDLILLPVYLLSYRYGDKVYRFLLNGQTGKTAGDKPLSWRKIAAAVLLAVGAIAAVVAIGYFAGR